MCKKYTWTLTSDELNALYISIDDYEKHCRKKAQEWEEQGKDVYAEICKDAEKRATSLKKKMQELIGKNGW